MLPTLECVVLSCFHGAFIRHRVEGLSNANEIIKKKTFDVFSGEAAGDDDEVDHH